MGSAATQIAKAAGAEIFGTASASKHDAIRAQGVDARDRLPTQDFEEEVMRITGGEGVDVVIDAPGAERASARTTACCAGRAPDHVRARRGLDREGPQHPEAVESLARMPTATMPWWKSLQVMNENKGVFGLNMLGWWDTEGDIDRIIEPLLPAARVGRPGAGRRRGLPVRARRATPTSFIAERTNIGKVVLVP